MMIPSRLALHSIKCCYPALYLPICPRSTLSESVLRSCIGKTQSRSITGENLSQQHAAMLLKFNRDKIFTSIAQLTPNMVKPAHAELLEQLSTLVSHTPSAAKQAWEVVGMVSSLVRLQSCGLLEVEEKARHNLSLLGYAPPYAGRGLRILSIDGGGTR